MRIAMLVGCGSSSAILVNTVRTWYPDADLLLIIERFSDRRAMLRYRLRRLGVVTVVGQIFFQFMILPVIRLTSRNRLKKIISEHNLDPTSAALEGALEVSSVNDQKVSDELKNFIPDIVLVNGTRIIKKKTLTCVDAPFVNTHVGITPMYRGVHGGYWALYNSDPKNFGVTVHLIDSGVDTGRPLRKVRVLPSCDDNFVTYPLLQQAAALGEIKEILSDLPKSLLTEESNQTEEFSRQWFHPTACQYFRGRLRGVR